jgi:predicted transcriptional regulator
MVGKYAFVMMVQGKWWQKFRRRLREGKQVHSYVQKGLAPPKNTSLILFYVTKPVGEMSGYADFVERKTGAAEDVWEEYGSESVLSSKQQYEEFVGKKRKVSFIRFKSLREVANPMPLKSVLMLLGVERLSRKGFYVDKKTAEKLLMSME